MLNILEYEKQIENSLDYASSLYVEVLNDTSLSLDDRWNMLIKFSKLGYYTTDYTFGGIEKLEEDDEWTISFGIEYQQTILVENILRRFIANAYLTDEEIIKFKRYCVNGHYTKFILDY